MVMIYFMKMFPDVSSNWIFHEILSPPAVKRRVFGDRSVDSLPVASKFIHKQRVAPARIDIQNTRNLSSFIVLHPVSRPTRSQTKSAVLPIRV